MRSDNMLFWLLRNQIDQDDDQYYSIKIIIDRIE